MTSAPVAAPTDRQNSVARPSSARFCVGSLISGGRLDDLELGLLLHLLLQEPVELRLQVDDWPGACPVALSASVTIRNGARATRSFPRSGRRGFKGRLQPDLGDARARRGRRRASAASARRVARAAAAGRRGRRGAYEPLAAFPGRARVGRVELGEARVVAPDVVVVRGELEGLLVFRRAPARNRRSPRGRRRGCCEPARCWAPWRAPARSGRRPRARDPCAPPRRRRRSARTAFRVRNTTSTPSPRTAASNGQRNGPRRLMVLAPSHRPMGGSLL